eukprot:scaffold7451_cov101-Isochrysis_galbana.AAC.1
MAAAAPGPAAGAGAPTGARCGLNSEYSQGAPLRKLHIKNTVEDLPLPADKKRGRRRRPQAAL